MTGVSKDSENLSDVRETEKILLIGPRRVNNNKGYNTGLQKNERPRDDK